VKDRANGIGAREPLRDWDSIDWLQARKRVSNLRQRIFRVSQNGQWNKVRSLMKLMIRSYSNLLLSVRKVTLENEGKKTPGVDRQRVLTAPQRVTLVRRMLKHKLWEAMPARRVYIPKADGKQRPLGILTIKNRVAQAIMKNALEPSWEARFEHHSYGFRPGRSCQDAIKQCWLRLNARHGNRWVLDADVKAAFDKISHEFVEDKLGLIPGRNLIRQWLKAGYVEAEIFHDTTSGVPQGGVISPVLSNIALDGMQLLVGPRLGYIRYADDFVVTAKTREELEATKPTIEEWLRVRGLELNNEKTRIVSISDGFNFLGFHVRMFQGKCLFKPQKEKVLNFLRELRAWLKDHASITAREVVLQLNAKIRGWANYYRHAVSKQTFAYVGSQIRLALWQWCLRRHPNKNKDWVHKKYFTHVEGRSWVFYAYSKPDKARGERDSRIYLFDTRTIRITRHVKVKGDASPDNPEQAEYWMKRSMCKEFASRPAFE
jgi:RNA-directed DNA polymerase